MPQSTTQPGLLVSPYFEFKSLPQPVVTVIQPASPMDQIKRTTYLPEVQSGDGAITDNKYGGIPFMSESDSWPICGCSRPLEFCLQLNLNLLPDNVDQKYGTGLLQFWKCRDEGCDPSDGHQVRIIQPSGTPAQVDPEYLKAHQFKPKRITGWKTEVDYPDGDEEVPAELQEQLEEQDLGPVQADKHAGWGHWTQGAAYPNCSTCNKKMTTLLFQLDSINCHHECGFGDAGSGMIMQCPNCIDQVAFEWASH